MATAIRLIDFGRKDLITGALVIAGASNGAFGISDIAELYYDEYEQLIAAIKENRDGK